MSLQFAPHDPVVPDAGAPTVREVRAFVVGDKALEAASGGAADCHSQETGHWIVDTPIANPMSPYSAYKASRTSWGIDALGSVIVEVELTDGTVGVGVSIGGEPACYIVEQHLARFVEGQDPRNVEMLWDQMYRATLNYGRKGLPIQALSAVDLALWDALGKLRGEPVCMLLGGKTKQRLPVYATTVRPDLAKRMGFKGAKVPLPYGPADGEAGLRGNIERLQAARASVGEGFPLMVDCYMALTVPYTIELAKRIEREVPGGVTWLEEFLPPDQYAGYAEVRRHVRSTMLTTGEHEYGVAGFRQLLEAGCADLLQPDVTWVGGITAARRVCALAAAFDVPVIPHGSGPYSYHLQFAFPNCPMAEFLVLSPRADRVAPLFGELFVDEPLPRDGFVELPDRPGFGVELNRAHLRLRRPSPHAPGSRPPPAPPAPADWLRDPVTELLRSKL